MGEVDYSIDHEESRVIENLVFLYLGECRTMVVSGSVPPACLAILCEHALRVE